MKNYSVRNHDDCFDPSTTGVSDMAISTTCNIPLWKLQETVSSSFATSPLSTRETVLENPCGVTPPGARSDVTDADADSCIGPGEGVRGFKGGGVGGVPFCGGPIILSNVGDRPDNKPLSR